ncbi:MAG: hypothetical protein OHK0052_02520 [Anaerolineales bacterium]
MPRPIPLELTPAERQKLQIYLSPAWETTIQTRAQIIFYSAQGLSAAHIRQHVSISSSRIYYWRKQFRQYRMNIFPDWMVDSPEAAHTLETAAPLQTVSIPLETARGLMGDAPAPETPSSPKVIAISPAQLRQTYPNGIPNAKRTRQIALALFDATQQQHALGTAERNLLETAALLHNLLPKPKQTRKILLSHPLSGFTPQEQARLAKSIRQHQRKRLKRIQRAYLAEPTPDLYLTALLRLAAACEQIPTQIESTPQVFALTLPSGSPTLPVQRAADLWQSLTAQRICIQAEPSEVEQQWLQLAQTRTAGLTPDQPMSTAALQIFAQQFGRILLHEPGTRLGEDIEALHDMRVATRRLRAAFELFAPYLPEGFLTPYRRGLRDLGRALGEVRDLDVLLEKAAQDAQEIPAEAQPAFDELLHLWQDQQHTARARLLETLDSLPRREFMFAFTQLLQTDLQTLPQTPLLHTQIPIVLYSHLAEVQAYEAQLPNASLETLHALRIVFKKLRYAVEFFRELLGEDVQKLISELKRIQDHLGNLNDAHVACIRLAALLNEWQQHSHTLPPEACPNPQGALAYLQYNLQRREQLQREFLQVWQRFNRPELRQYFAQAVSVL